jgi:hypothetical protein
LLLQTSDFNPPQLGCEFSTASLWGGFASPFFMIKTFKILTPEEVSFLKDKHRHIFHIKIKKQVTHNDRELEIILFKRNILEYLNSTFKNDFGEMSCEDIAENLINKFNLKSCEVLEDNENGAFIEI